MLTGRKPDVKDLKIFGSRIVAKNPEKRAINLNDHTSRGIFLHHISSTTISKFLDDSVGREKTSSLIVYDGAHYTQETKPAGAQVLINNRYTMTMVDPVNPQSGETTEMGSVTEQSSTKQLLIKKLSKNIIMPARATEGSTGLDLYNANAVTIAPGEIKLIPTDIAIECPQTSYGTIAPKSGVTIKRKLDVSSGVIDSDYRGNVIITMYNIGDETQVIDKGTKIAQLIIEQIVDVQVQEQSTMTTTERADKGFGTTDTQHAQIEYKDGEVSTKIPEDDGIIPIIQSFSSQCEIIYLSADPFGPTLPMIMTVRGVYDSLGLTLDNNSMRGRLLLANCEKGAPSHRMKRWRSTLRESNRIEIDEKIVSHIQEVKDTIQCAPDQKKTEMIMMFITEEKIHIHSGKGYHTNTWINSTSSEGTSTK